MAADSIGLRRQLIATTALAAIMLTAGPAISLTVELPGQVARADSGSCCFTAETLVTMSDRSRRPIGDIALGDMVLGHNGAANRVVGIERVRLGDRALFGVNADAPFFTDEHPFLTTEGWRAVAPEPIADWDRYLRIGRLRPGARLLMLVERFAMSGALALAPAIHLAEVELTLLTAETGPAELIVYNLLLDGDHTYFANGYVVHNKDGAGGDGDGGDGDGGDGDSDGDGDGGDGDGGEGGSGGSGGEGGEGGSGGSGGSGGEGGEGGSGGSGGEGGEGGSGGSGGEGGESGSGGEGGGTSPQGGGFPGTAEPAGKDLTPAQERDIISRGWK